MVHYAFFWGGFLKRFYVRINPKFLLPAYFIIALFMTTLYAAKAYLRVKNGGHGLVIERPAYNGLAFPLSILLFLYFQQTSFKRNILFQILTTTSPFAFGVYLIHEHLLFRNYIWQNTFFWTANLDKPWYLILVLGFIIALYLLCVGIDYLRELLFSLIKIPEWSSKVTNYVSNTVNSRLQRYDSQRKSP